MKQSSIKITVARVGVLLSFICLLLSTPAVQAQTSAQPTACENSFAGAVFFDQNQDGVHAQTERYLPGQIEIVDDQGATQQAIESPDGVFSARSLACNTYQIQHNQVVVGTVVIGEIMTQEVKMFPKVQTVFFPLVAYQAR